MYDTDKLLTQIETLRNQMTEVALSKGITSLESITLSQELDRLLNIYNEIKTNDKEKNR
ncbi:Spo0E family sporulation regulatory protein-aspartic acid phosphatase [Ornithinibacillus sp. L9]|uniref:Spo0E family sporulation regulatory protein-aspartic acid phosphatase n=1 Tax=Ornithinibacillus caprae TaxID=2678566 RepID=A0A6N8FLJ5_9BACI|nr:aspartyl-phosphate phosphatase Spo0E family protein [Ornithinibacillus caprae]MUK90243.1 Spo0E family sporulation regulatory protein-aspartic acid phosphatase [Ornithinibacillus caprae]